MDTFVATPGQRLRQTLQTIVLAVAGLYFGREVLIPLAMAILLTFLLSPMVTWLEKRKVPRIPAVILVMACIFSAFCTGGYLVVGELTSLGANLPEYRQNLRGRLEGMLPEKAGVFDHFKNIASDVQEVFGGQGKGNEDVSESEKDQVVAQVESAVGTLDADAKQQVLQTAESEASSLSPLSPETETAQPVRIVSDSTAIDTIGAYTSTVLAPLANLAIIAVLVTFMLIQREDLRNRLVRLAGKKLTLTTRTLDEVGTRISRYLLALLFVNGTYGMAVALGLLVIGVPYALLWGTLATVLRFIPYVGPIMSAGFAIAMSLVHFPSDDWFHPGMTIGLIVVLELISNNVVEPLVYGRSTGVSIVAILVSATFWTWLWGPVGLMLSVPMTIVLAVLGEHIPVMEPLAILLGDKPALSPSRTYYQRLLAEDSDEAASIATDYIKEHSLTEMYDRVLIPALVLAERDRINSELSQDEQEFIWQSTQELIEDPDFLAAGPIQTELAENPRLRVSVLGCPAHDQADTLSLQMLSQLLDLSGGKFEIMPTSNLASESLAQIGEHAPDAVFIASLGPQGSKQARYLCKRIRTTYPQLRIVVGRWGYRGDKARLAQNLKSCGADTVITTLADACNALQRITPLAPQIKTSSADSALNA